MTTTPMDQGTTPTASSELAAIGMGFPRWQEAVEAAIKTDRLAVTGEIRGGQLIQYTDPSGAQLNILAVEPYATFIGFKALTTNFGNVTMVNDVLALIDVVDQFGDPKATVTANLAQGPLLVEEDTQEWQQLDLAAMGLDVKAYPSVDSYVEQTGENPDRLDSEGAEIVSSGSGAKAPTPAIDFSGRVVESMRLDNELTGQQFIHVVLDGKIPFDLCLPDSFGDLPQKGTVLAGRALLTAAIAAPAGGCGSGGGCGCGGCGCGGH